MWKWILGAVVLVVLLIGSGVWWGFRKMTAFANGDSTVTVTIGATPERVFASLADGDSLGDWMGGGHMRASRSGRLRLGDTLYFEQRDTNRTRQLTWVVDEVIPGKAFAMRLALDTLSLVAITRRYVVLAQGESTAVLNTVTSPMMDSARRDASQGGGAAMMNFTSKLMVGAMRMQSQMELRQLKARLEGTQVAAPGSPRP